MKKKIVTVLIVVAVLSILFAIFSPKTSYVKIQNTDTSFDVIWDYKLYDDIPSVTLYKDVWVAGERVLSERITDIIAPEAGTIAMNNELRKRKEIEGSTYFSYDFDVIVEGKQNTHQHLEAEQELYHSNTFLATYKYSLGLDTKGKVILEPDKNYILSILIINSTDGFSVAPLENYAQWEDIFKEEPDCSHIVFRMET